MDMTTNELRIRSVLNRLETIVDAENAGIGADPNFDLQTSNAHKSRCLYELSMLSRDVPAEEMPRAFAPQLKKVREKLLLNAQRVSAHLEAVRVVDEQKIRGSVTGGACARAQLWRQKGLQSVRARYRFCQRRR